MVDRIPNQEYEQRLKKLQNLLRTNNIDGLFCIPGVNFQYMLKSRAKLMERLVLAILTPASLELICPAFEVSNFESLTISKEHIHPWEETDDPHALLKVVTKSLGIEDGNIALSPSTPFTMYVKMQDSLSKVSFKDGYPLFKTARITKTIKELELLKEANKITARSIETVFDQLEVGMTEKQVALSINKELTSRSGEPFQFAAVQFGENSALPHGSPTDKKLKKNDVVLIDAGTSVEGYNGDITNTMVFGKPSAKFLEIYDVVEEANKRGVEAVKVGAIPEKIDSAARDFITSRGYGQFFTHRTGHGIGLEVHEDPYIVNGNLTPLGLNQTFSIEPGIYLPGKLGVRIEDIIISRKNKGERTCNPRRHLWEKN
jgi:Xaa-Pro dipeptidase